MGGTAMNRYWIALPMLVMAAVPTWTDPSAPVAALEAMACLLCALGVFLRTASPVTAGGCIAIIGYGFALWSGNDGVDVIGAAIFGLALLSLVDMSEFARRFRGAEIANDVMRAQTTYWLGRSTLIVGVIVVLTLGGSAVAAIVPGLGRAVIVGLGAVIAFAGALYGGIVRRPEDA
jgi:hypothetical protein